MMSTKNRIVGALCFLAISFMLTFPCGAQTDTTRTNSAQPARQTRSDENERGTIKSEEFTVSRPVGNNPSPRRYRYRQRVPKTTSGTPPKGQLYATVGVTIGRGCPATEAESEDYKVAKVRLKDGRELVFERISDTSPVEHGTLMQMMIEYLASPDASGKKQSDRVGYLYVINRVLYPNGTHGPARLIFPTQRTYGGDNRVLPGKTVMLPDPHRPWEITRSKSGTAQAFETYIIIISTEPLKELQGDKLSDKALRGLFAGCTPLWDCGESRGDLESGTGRLITQREQAATGDPSARERDTGELDSDLTQGDPPPQMVFTKVLKPGGKLLVTIKLPFKDTAATITPKP
jgi:hypothetical protein